MKYKQTETTFKARIYRFSKFPAINVGDVDDDDEIGDSDWEVDWSLGVATSQDVPLRRCVLLCLAPQYDSM